MLDGGIALCDAGTGISKTYACLVAGIAFQQYRAFAGQPLQTILISTSSIALQNAIQQDYLPFLSEVLGILVWSVVRKGKSNYVCDERLERRLHQGNRQKMNPAAMKALLMMQNALDLDEASCLSDYDRERICVPAVCDCNRQYCRYRDFLDACGPQTHPAGSLCALH